MSTQENPRKIISPNILSRLQEELSLRGIQYKIIKDPNGPSGGTYYLLYFPQDEDSINDAIASAEYDRLNEELFDAIAEQEQAMNQMTESDSPRSLSSRVLGAEERINSVNNSSITNASRYNRIYVQEIFKDDLVAQMIDAGIQNYELDKDERGYFVRAPEDVIKKIDAIHKGLLTSIANQDEPQKQEPKVPAPDSRKKPGPKKMNRDIRYQLRFTEEEMKQLDERVKASGKRKGDFGREMLLNGYVKTVTIEGMLAIQELQTMASQLGKLTGAMVKFMQQTKDSPYLSKEERDEIQREINNMKKLRSDIRKEIKKVWK